MARIWCIYNRHNFLWAVWPSEQKARQQAAELRSEYPRWAPYVVREEEWADTERVGDKEAPND